MTYLTAPGAMFVSFGFKTLNTEEIKIIDLSKLNKSSFVSFGCFREGFKKKKSMEFSISSGGTPPLQKYGINIFFYFIYGF